MANSIGNIARELSVGTAARRATRKSTRRNSSTSSGGASKTTTGGSGTKPKFTLADLKAFNALPDKVRKASKKKIAAFQAAGVGVFEDYSVHTSGKGFGKFFSKTSPQYKKGNK